MSRLKNCDLGKKKENTLHSFRLLHKRVELSIFFFFENFGFAVDEWWYNNYNNKNISIYIAAFARGCKALLPIITVSGKLSQPASQSYSFTEGCYWPSANLILAYFPWPIAPWCAQVDEAIEINASFRLAWRLPLRRLHFQSFSSQRPRRFGFITERHLEWTVCGLALWVKWRDYWFIGKTPLTAWSSLCGCKWRLRSFTKITIEAAIPRAAN